MDDATAAAIAWVEVTPTACGQTQLTGMTENFFEPFGQNMPQVHAAGKWWPQACLVSVVFCLSTPLRWVRNVKVKSSVLALDRGPRPAIFEVLVVDGAHGR